MYAYLQKFREDCPDWLQRFDAGDSFSARDFFGGRTVYYPGFGNDGHAVKVFGSTHASHCFVMADYCVERASVEAELCHPDRSFRGYEPFVIQNLQQRDLTPHGWMPHHSARQPHIGSVTPYAMLVILQRDALLDEGHGPARLALLFLGADGHATYDALYCQHHTGIRPPFGILLQDHCFGGNYSRWGNEGIMHDLASTMHVYPDFLLIGPWTTPWEGYAEIAGTLPERGGMHSQRRHLYVRQNG